MTRTPAFDKTVLVKIKEASTSDEPFIAGVSFDVPGMGDTFVRLASQSLVAPMGE